MASGYLIDTSAVIKYLNGSFPEPALEFMDSIVDGASNLSFVSEIELQVWTPENPDDLSVYQQFVLNSIVIGVDDDIIAETIRVRKSHKIKLPDALIAATAIVNGLTLIADNDKDFLKVPALEYINPKSR
ncbi:type II toxin-antitoxin system VapC family toxin [Parapedobacter defluvii]|uniref:type II toxin-antitoxin system VapC family toxin n=1 Tax=Parapedobacter defluvii TaxID=2045106 RepID=UPI00333F4BFD